MTEMTEYPHGLFCWVDLVAHDLEAAKRWYGELFGWTAEDSDTEGGPPYVIFSKDGKAVAGGGQMMSEMKAAGVPAMWNDYVKVNDCAATEAKAIELGATVAMPTMQVMDAGWMCFLQDPTGAHVGMWQPNRHHGAALVNSPGAFCWNELATGDVEAAKRFYAGLFGWDYSSDTTAEFQYISIRLGSRENGGIMAMAGPEWEGASPHWNTYFTVEDIAATVAQIRETGGKIMVEPHEIPNVGRFAVVSDPQGASFSVIELLEEPS
jgi:uncharacterized protein